MMSKTTQKFKRHIEISGGSFGDWSVDLDTLLALVSGDTPGKYVYPYRFFMLFTYIQ